LSMLTHCGIQLTKAPLMKLNMSKTMLLSLLLILNGDVTSVMLALNYSLKHLQAGEEITY